MGKRGPKPLPSNVLRLRGSWRAEEREAHEVKATDSPPTMPEWLGDDAAAYWPSVSEAVAGIPGLARAPDGMALGLLCQSLADYLRARTVVADDGRYIPGSTGSLVPHPALVEMNRAYARLAKQCALFGLSPSDRIGLRGDQRQPSKSGKGEFFGSAGGG